jgi:hypothetical protein
MSADNHATEQKLSDSELAQAIYAFESAIQVVQRGELPDGMVDADHMALLAMRELQERRRKEAK